MLIPNLIKDYLDIFNKIKVLVDHNYITAQEAATIVNIQFPTIVEYSLYRDPIAYENPQQKTFFNVVAYYLQECGVTKENFKEEEEEEEEVFKNHGLRKGASMSLKKGASSKFLKSEEELIFVNPSNPTLIKL